MRRVVAVEYLSLDGVMEDPGTTGDYPHRGWTMPFWHDDLMKWQSGQLFASDALLLGRVTYEEFVASWPQRSGDPFSDKFNSMRKYIASRTLKEPLPWNSTLLHGDLVQAVEKLKAENGGDLLIYGSATMVSDLIPHRVIDEYRLMIYPLVLGSGERLFKQSPEVAQLKLDRAETSASGVTLLVYRPA